MAFEKFNPREDCDAILQAKHCPLRRIVESKLPTAFTERAYYELSEGACQDHCSLIFFEQGQAESFIKLAHAAIEMTGKDNS